MGYRDLEIWKRSLELAVIIHKMTLEDLPRFEMYETGSQIRRSMKSVSANIVEGFGRRRYKLDFIHFLIYAEASLDETINHLEILYRTGSLKEIQKYEDIKNQLHELGRMINKFITSVQHNHQSQ